MRQLAYRVLFAALIVGIAGIFVFAFRAGWFSVAPAPGYVANPSIQGALVSATDSSIVLSLANGKHQAYTLAPHAKVVSQVKTGETGKALAEFPLQSLVSVQPEAKGSTVVQSVTLSPEPFDGSQNPLGPPVVAAGPVTAITDTALIIKDSSQQEMTFILTKNTEVYANVLAGQPGKSVRDVAKDSYVQVSGHSGTQGAVADAVQVFGPLQ